MVGLYRTTQTTDKDPPTVMISCFGYYIAAEPTYIAIVKLPRLDTQALSLACVLQGRDGLT